MADGGSIGAFSTPSRNGPGARESAAAMYLSAFAMNGAIVAVASGRHEVAAAHQFVRFLLPSSSPRSPEQGDGGFFASQHRALPVAPWPAGRGPGRESNTSPSF